MNFYQYKTGAPAGAPVARVGSQAAHGGSPAADASAEPADSLAAIPPFAPEPGGGG